MTRVGGIESESSRERLPWAATATSEGANAHEIALVALESFPTWTLRRLFSSIPSELELTELRLSHRPDRCLQSAGHRTFADLSDCSVASLFEIRTMGAKSVVEIVEALVSITMRKAPAPEDPVITPGSTEPLPALTLTDLRRFPQITILGKWLIYAGEPASRIASVDQSDPLVPDEVRAAAQWLQELTPLALGIRAERVCTLLDALFAGYDKRALDILRARVLLAPSETLETLGQRWQVTRERIRQLETKVGSGLRSAFAADHDLQTAAAGIRRQLAPIMRLDRLLEANLDLTSSVEVFGLPAWRVLDKLDDQFESDGVWIARPSLQQVRTDTENRFDTLGGVHRAVTVHGVLEGFPDWSSLNASELLDWLYSIGYTVVDDVVFAPSVRSIPDRAVATLGLIGRPMSAEEVHLRAVPDRALSSLTNAMAVDARISRVGRDAWGLAEWGLPEYSNIRDAIRSVLDEDGQVPLKDLAEHLRSEHGVSMSSVATYASAWPFETVSGYVRHAQVRPKSTATITDARRTYRVGSAVLIRIPVTKDHLRGSGSPAPAGMLSALGMDIGSKRTFSNPVAEVTLRWEPLSPNFSSLRAHIMALDLHIGDELKLRFEGEMVHAERAPLKSEDPVQQLCALLEIDHVQLPAFSERLGLSDEATWADVLSTFRRRGESDVVDLLVGVLSSPRTFT